MNDKTSKLTDKVNVTMHISSIADKAVSYARVQRSTGYIGNVIDKEVRIYIVDKLQNQKKL